MKAVSFLLPRVTSWPALGFSSWKEIVYRLTASVPNGRFAVLRSGRCGQPYEDRVGELSNCCVKHAHVSQTLLA
jgi:hypothetical protein